MTDARNLPAGEAGEVRPEPLKAGAKARAAGSGQAVIAERLRVVLQRRGVGSAAALYELVKPSRQLPAWARSPQRRTVERHYGGQVRMTPQDVALYLTVVGEVPETMSYVITGEERLFADKDPEQNSRQVAEVVQILTSFIPGALLHVEPQYLSPRFGVERGRFVLAYEDTLRPLRDLHRDVEWMRLHHELLGAGAEPQGQLLRRGAHTQRLRAILGLEPIAVTRQTPGAEEIAAAVRPPLLVTWVPGLTRRRDPEARPHPMQDGAQTLIVCGYAGMYGASVGPMIADGMGWGFLDLDRTAARHNRPIGESVARLLDGGELPEHMVVGTRLAKSTEAVLAAVAADPHAAAEAGIRLLLPRMLDANLSDNIRRDDDLATGKTRDALKTALPARGPVVPERRESWAVAAALCQDIRWKTLRDWGLLWEIENLPWLHYGTTTERSESGVATAAMCIGWLNAADTLHPASRRWTQPVYENRDGTSYLVPRQLWAELDRPRAIGILHRGDTTIALPAPVDGERTYAERDRSSLPFDPMSPHDYPVMGASPRRLAEAEPGTTSRSQASTDP